MNQIESRSKMIKKKKYALAGFLLAGLMTIGMATSVWAEDTTFVSGTTVNGLGVSGMTVEEAAKRIGDFYNSEYKLTIKERGRADEVIVGSEIGFAVALPQGLLQEILNQQNTAGRASGPSVDNSHRAEMQNTYDEQALNAKMGALGCVSGSDVVTTTDARISGYQEGQPFMIIPEVRGNNVYPDKVAAAIRAAVASGATEVDLEAAGCYYEVQVTSDNADLIALCNTMNQCREMSITYVFGEQSELLDPATICSWITGGENGTIGVNRDAAAAYIKTLAERYDTAGKTRTLRTATGRDVNIKGPYGWKINRTAETDALIGMIRTGQTQSREPEYSSKAVNRSAQEWGNTYVEVDLTGQHVYMIKDGVQVWDAPCVTGNLSKQYDTPEGIYGLYYKERDKVLRGAKQADGTYEYESPVSYWMPFNGGIGLHDANWRGKFGGNIYKTSGSHGCINLPPSKTQALYDMVYKGMPVFCYY